jgi:hypothetical protein
MKLKLLVRLSVVLVCCCGCRHATRNVPPRTQLNPGPPARQGSPRLVVTTNSAGPVNYQWGFTNTDQGTKVLRFAPNQ